MWIRFRFCEGMWPHASIAVILVRRHQFSLAGRPLELPSRPTREIEKINLAADAGRFAQMILGEINKNRWCCGRRIGIPLRVFYFESGLFHFVHEQR